MLYVWVFACMQVCTSQVWSLMDQKKISHPWNRRLQTVASHHVDAGSWTPVLWDSSKCSPTVSHPSGFLLNAFLWSNYHPQGWCMQSNSPPQESLRNERSQDFCITHYCPLLLPHWLTGYVLFYHHETSPPWLMSRLNHGFLFLSFFYNRLCCPG